LSERNYSQDIGYKGQSASSNDQAAVITAGEFPQTAPSTAYRELGGFSLSKISQSQFFQHLLLACSLDNNYYAEKHLYMEPPI